MAGLGPAPESGARPQLPADSQLCRRRAEQALADGETQTAIAWALLGVCGELADTRRQAAKAGRR